jgi:DNA-binding NarL/FixJ family response regulator
MELARALGRWEIHPEPGAPLPVPVGLHALVADRVRSLSPPILEIVAGTAAAWRFTDAGLDPDDLAEAVRSGVVVHDRHVVRAAHPLLSAAAYAELTPRRRRALHARLSAATEDPVEYARHAALAGTGAPEELPALLEALDAGAAAALSAGTPDIAAQLIRLAVGHSGDDNERLARLNLLADALIRTGDTEGSADALGQAVALAPPGGVRAWQRIRLAEVLTEVENGWMIVEAELTKAAEEACDDPAVEAEALLTLAAIVDDVKRSETAVNRAVELLGRMDDPDPAVYAFALSQAAGARFLAGHGLDHETFARAIEIEQRMPGRRLSDTAEASYAALLKFADDFDGAETRLRSLLDAARAVGDLSSIAFVLGHLPHIELWRGRLPEAEMLAREHLAIAEQGSLDAQAAAASYNLGLVFAFQGRLDEAETRLRALLDGPRSPTWDRLRAHGSLGFVAMSRPDATAAVALLDEWDSLLRGINFGEPGYSRFHLDYTIALIESGRLSDAAEFLDRLEQQAISAGRRSARMIARTGRALLLAAHGSTDEASASIRASIRDYDGSTLRFDRARTLLLAGRIHRRAKAKALASEALHEALREFRSFGALAWAAQAERELSRVNLRPTAPAELTETERRVAELAASGLTNREVADRMFIAIKTVEANLARAYRKLGIRSRAELGARMGRVE